MLTAHAVEAAIIFMSKNGKIGIIYKKLYCKYFRS